MFLGLRRGLCRLGRGYFGTAATLATFGLAPWVGARLATSKSGLRLLTEGLTGAGSRGATHAAEAAAEFVPRMTLAAMAGMNAQPPEEP